MNFVSYLSNNRQTTCFSQVVYTCASIFCPSNKKIRINSYKMYFKVFSQLWAFLFALLNFHAFLFKFCCSLSTEQFFMSQRELKGSIHTWFSDSKLISFIEAHKKWFITLEIINNLSLPLQMRAHNRQHKTAQKLGTT